MKQSIIVAVAFASILALAGCYGEEPAPEPAPVETPEPAPAPIKADEDAEAAYLAELVASMPTGVDSPESRAAVLELGYWMCENAREKNSTTGDIAQIYIDALDREDESWMLMMGTALLAGKNAGEQLCPEYAG